MEHCWKRLPLKHAYNVRDLGGYASEKWYDDQISCILSRRWIESAKGRGMEFIKGEWNLYNF